MHDVIHALENIKGAPKFFSTDFSHQYTQYGGYGNIWGLVTADPDGKKFVFNVVFFLHDLMFLLQDIFFQLLLVINVRQNLGTLGAGFWRKSRRHTQHLNMGRF